MGEGGNKRLWAHVPVEEEEMWGKRGQGSDLSYTEEKNGNNTLVTIKKEEKFEV